MACLSSSMPLAQTNSGLGFRLYCGNDVNRRALTGLKCVRLCKDGETSVETVEKSDGLSMDAVLNLHPTASRSQQDSYVPLVSAVKSTAEENTAGFHFPGHNKGQGAPSSLTDLIGQKTYYYDIYGLPEMDLFSQEGPIYDAQKQAAKVFGASQTWFLTSGTTCGVQAAIMATCSPGDTLILPRNSHVSAISGMVLSGAIPRYINTKYDLDWEIASPATLSEVKEGINDLESEGRKIGAVFVTSPSYYGMCANLKEISELCHSRGIPLIVDEAHGAHFGFHQELPFSALQQGADVVVQSTHKVLCSLTQSSMLHNSHSSLVDGERIGRCLLTLQSTSPSFLLLASLDAATSQLRSNPQSIFDRAIGLASKSKNDIKQILGLSLLDCSSDSHTQHPSFTDPLRVVIGFQKLGISGYQADEFLYENQSVVPEMVGSRTITFVFTPGIQQADVDKLLLGLEHLSSYFLRSYDHQMTAKPEHKLEFIEPFDKFEVELNPRDAFFSKKKKVSVVESVGTISGELICPYPPGIPVMIPGEVITKRALDYIQSVRRAGGVISGASDPTWSSIVVCDNM